METLINEIKSNPLEVIKNIEKNKFKKLLEYLSNEYYNKKIGEFQSKRDKEVNKKQKDLMNQETLANINIVEISNILELIKIIKS